MHVCVLGAGIVGLATAYSLQRAGHHVTVLDRGAPGTGASEGNGAQLSYAYVQPLADPAIWGQIPKLLLAADSPLKLRLRLDARQWRWLAGFMAACNAGTSRRTTAALLALAAESRTAFDAMRADLAAQGAADIDYSEPGKLVIYRGAEALAGAGRQVELQATLGSPAQRIVTAAEAIAIEPALAADAAGIAGAVFTPSECAADCFKVCQVLAAAIAARGGAIVTGCEVLGLQASGGRVTAARTRQGGREAAVQADAFVLALGAASPAIARPLGLSLPVYPLKGYSLTLDLAGAPAHAAPRVSITDSPRKVVYARLGERLRVAGMVEIVGHADTRVLPARIASLHASTLALFPQLARAPELMRWSGMRPATPTAQPIVGRVPGAPRGLLVNTGHGALGFTLAFGSAERVVRALDA